MPKPVARNRGPQGIASLPPSARARPP